MVLTITLLFLSKRKTLKESVSMLLVPFARTMIGGSFNYLDFVCWRGWTSDSRRSGLQSNEIFRRYEQWNDTRKTFSAKSKLFFRRCASETLWSCMIPAHMPLPWASSTMVRLWRRNIRERLNSIGDDQANCAVLKCCWEMMNLALWFWCKIVSSPFLRFSDFSPSLWLVPDESTSSFKTYSEIALTIARRRMRKCVTWDRIRALFIARRRMRKCVTWDRIRALFIARRRMRKCVTWDRIRALFSQNDQPVIVVRDFFWMYSMRNILTR